MLSGSGLPGLPLTTSTCTPWAIDLDTEEHDIYNLYECDFRSYGAPAVESAAITSTYTSACNGATTPDSAAITRTYTSPCNGVPEDSAAITKTYISSNGVSVEDSSSPCNGVQVDFGTITGTYTSSNGVSTEDSASITSTYTTSDNGVSVDRAPITRTNSSCNCSGVSKEDSAQEVCNQTVTMPKQAMNLPRRRPRPKHVPKQVPTKTESATMSTSPTRSDYSEAAWGQWGKRGVPNIAADLQEVDSLTTPSSLPADMVVELSPTKEKSKANRHHRRWVGFDKLAKDHSLASGPVAKVTNLADFVQASEGNVTIDKQTDGSLVLGVVVQAAAANIPKDKHDLEHQQCVKYVIPEDCSHIDPAVWHSPAPVKSKKQDPRDCQRLCRGEPGSGGALWHPSASTCTIGLLSTFMAPSKRCADQP